MSSISTSQKLVLAFVTLILGVILVGVVASQGLTSTQKTTVTGESNDASSCYVYANVSGDDYFQVNEGDSTCDITLTNAPTGWKSSDCPLTSVSVTNGTATSTWTVDTDYTLSASTGVISLLNTSTTQHPVAIANGTSTTYTYCQDGYVNLGWGRTAIDLVSGFFAIALLMIALGLFYSVARDEKII